MQFLLACIILSFAESDPTGMLVGRIEDASTKEPLAYANVILKGTMLGGATNASGYFKVGRIPAGEYVAVASCIGYEPAEIHVRVEAGDTVHIRLSLQSKELIGEHIVISATRKEQTALMAPASVSVITANDLTAANVKTFDQAIESSTGLQVVHSSPSNVQSVSIRGASETAGGGTGNRVLLLIDGRPAISPESGGALWNLVPTTAVERVEIVKGAYSSLYGSSAMGGVINVITKQPSDVTETIIRSSIGFYDRAPAYTGYTRQGWTNDFTVGHSRHLGRTAWLIDVARKESQGHKENSAYEMYHLYSKTSTDLGLGRRLQWSVNYNRIANDAPATWLSFLQPYDVAEYKKDDTQLRREFNTDVYYDVLRSAHMKYSTRFYFYRNDSRYDFNADPDNDSTNVNTGNQIIDRERIIANRFGNVTQIDLHLGERHYLISGWEGQFDAIHAVPEEYLYGKRQATNLAAYAQDEIRLSERWTSTFGIRYDFNKIIDGYSEGNVSPKAAFVYRIRDTWSVRALFAQAFRTPSIAERYIQFEQGGGLRFQQNPNLKAERLYLSAEIGTKFDVSNHLQFDVSLYHNRYRNLIFYHQLSGPPNPLLFEIRNLNRALIQGFECDLRFKWDSWLRVAVGYAYLDARDRSSNRTDDNLPYKAKHTASIQAGLTYRHLSLDVNARHRSAIKEVFIYAGSEPAAYTVVNARAGYSFGSHRIYVACQNITHQQYEEIERYRMPGRTFSLGLELHFK